MNWSEQAGQRRLRYIRLCEAKRLCVLAGDRIAVRLLDDCLRRARERLHYAEKMLRVDRAFCVPLVAPFATPEKARDNHGPMGS